MAYKKNTKKLEEAIIKLEEIKQDKPKSNETHSGNTK